MAAKTMSGRGRAAPKAVPVRKITSEDLWASLREGLDDFRDMRGDLIFVGLLYPLIGIVAAVAIIGGPLVPLFFPIAAGIGLLGPLVAVGFYEMARRREAGLTSNWSHFLDVRRRPSADEIGYVAILLLGIFALWLVSAGLLYLLLWGFDVPTSISEFAARLFTTREGWALVVIGNLLGLFFATLVLATSVVSMPMLVDCDVSAGDAVALSVAAVRANPWPMLQWGVIVAVLLVVGSIPLFVGLAVVLPWLGYATWHLYGRLIDRGALPGKCAAD